MPANSALKAALTRLTEIQRGDTNAMDLSSQHHSIRFGPATDRLSTLPPELLHIIFEMVEAQTYSWDTKIGAINRALLPYTRKNFFKEVSVDSLVRLKQFANTVVYVERKEERFRLVARHQAEYLGSLVGSLEVSLSSEDPEDPKWEEFDSTALFAALPHLTSVRLSFCTALTNALGSSKVAQMHLRELRIMEITGIRVEYNLFSLECLGNLVSYPQLKEVDLTFLEEGDGETLLDSRMPKPLPMIHVTILNLTGCFCYTPNTELASFIGAHRHLESLDLTDVHGSLDLNVVLGQVQSPLKHLSICVEVDEGLPSLSQALKRLSQLETIDLGYATYDASTLQALEYCRELRRINFGGSDRSSLSYSSLNDFIKPGFRPKALKELELNFFDEGEIGDDLDSLDYTPEEPENVKWELPDWSDTFSYENAKTFTKMAAQTGICVSGTIEDAIEVQLRWNEGISGINQRREQKRQAEERAKKALGEMGVVA